MEVVKTLLQVILFADFWILLTAIRVFVRTRTRKDSGVSKKYIVWETICFNLLVEMPVSLVLTMRAADIDELMIHLIFTDFVLRFTEGYIFKLLQVRVGARKSMKVAYVRELLIFILIFFMRPGEWTTLVYYEIAGAMDNAGVYYTRVPHNAVERIE